MSGIRDNLLGCLFLAALAPQAGLASQCLGPYFPCAAWARAGAVWVGTVDSSVPGRMDPVAGKPAEYLVTMAVDEVFLGNLEVGARIEVSGGAITGMGFSPQVGERFLIHAQHADGTGFAFGGCHFGAWPLEGAGEGLAYARALQGGVPEPSFRGVVGWMSLPHLGGAGLAGVRILLSGAGGDHEAVTNEVGEFHFGRLWPGEYHVEVQSEGRRVRGMLRGPEIQVPSYGCAVDEIVMMPENRLSGRVLDEVGNPRSKVSVQVVPLPPLRPGNLVGRLVVADSQGRFEIEGLPSGQYRLGVNIARGPTDRRPYPATFYPGTTDWEQSAVISVGDSSNLTGLDFRLGPALRGRIIRGRVLHADGSPAVRARVGAFDPRFHDRDYRHSSDVVRTDETGAFAVLVYEGIAYRLEASLSVRNGGSRCAPIVDAPAEDDSTELVLVLSMDEAACKQQGQAQIAGPRAEPQ